MIRIALDPKSVFGVPAGAVDVAESRRLLPDAVTTAKQGVAKP